MRLAMILTPVELQGYGSFVFQLKAEIHVQAKASSDVYNRTTNGISNAKDN